MKLKININGEKLSEILERCIGEFKELESKQLNDVNIEDCIKDYLDVIFIARSDLFDFDGEL